MEVALWIALGIAVLFLVIRLGMSWILRERD
jgi:hypothetical protein